MNLCQPIVPRNADGMLRAIIPGRISQPTQDVDSIGSQQEDTENWLRRVHAGAIKVKALGEQASGWLADRASMLAAQDLIASGEWDVVVVSELREIYRNPAFHWTFVQFCIDHDVRFISVADNIDTADPNWEIMMHTASLRHGMAVPEIRRRVHRKANFSFARGGMVGKVKYGYRKLSKDEAAIGTFGTIGLRIAKLSACTPTILEMRGRMLRGDSYVQIAQWLNDAGINPGPYVENGKWTACLVKGLLRDPILSGQRRFRNTLHQIVYKTGRHRSRPNPEGPAVQEYPELAHMTPEEHARLLAAMDTRKERWQICQPKGRESPLWQQARSRSAWPGQHATCASCEGRMYRYGEFLRCENSLPASTEKCWNHVQVDFKYVFGQVLPWLVGVLDNYPDTRQKLISVVWQEFELREERSRRQAGKFDARMVQLTKEKDNFIKAIRAGGPLESLVAELGAVEAEFKRLHKERQDLEGKKAETTKFLSSDAVAANLLDAVTELAHTSLDFAEILRQLLPVFIIQPVQALDCGLVRPRAKLTLKLEAQDAVGQDFKEESVTLDLFDRPVHIRHLTACVRAKEADTENKKSLRTIASELGIGYMTVKRALAYHRLMLNEGLTDPYRDLTEKPEAASRWRKRSS